MTVILRTVAPLPICPPLIPGESFTSWVNRIAYRSSLPLGLLLHRLTVAATDLHSGMPANYGLSLTAAQIQQVAAITGVNAQAVAGSLLSGYRDGPLGLAALDDEASDNSLAIVTRNEWLHLTHSLYCPDCLRETGGAWKLGWRLPWSFTCTSHHVLLNTTCPDCQQPTAQARGDRTARPNFVALVPEPECCGSALSGADIGYVGRPGRAARPCRQNLADALAVHLDDPAASVILSSQTALDHLLKAEGHRQTWADLRALVTVLMFFADTSTLTNLAPDLTEPLFTARPVVDAVTVHDLARQQRIAHQQLLHDGGTDHRSGVRQRYGTATPNNPALMAALVPIAQRLHGPLPVQPHQPTPASSEAAETALAALIRHARDRHKQLPQMLAVAGASPALLERAECAARSTGKFTYATPVSLSPSVPPSTIPAYLWEEEARPFLACLPGTREDTARKFASLYLGHVS